MKLREVLAWIISPFLVIGLCFVMVICAIPEMLLFILRDHDDDEEDCLFA